MAKNNVNNVKGALDDWGFDAPKINPAKEIKPTIQEVGKSASKVTVIPKTKKNTTVTLKSENQLPKKQAPKVVEQTFHQVEKSENQNTETSDSNFNTEEKLILRSKTFDLPPEMIKKIKIEAAMQSKKEYVIALEAFTQYFENQK